MGTPAKQDLRETVEDSWLKSCDLRVLATVAEVEQMVTYLLTCDTICFDTETTGLRVIDDDVVALQFCGDGQRAYFIPVAMLDQRFTNISMGEVVRVCAPLWEKGFVGHNLGFDWKMMVQHGADFNIVADTLLMSKLYDVYDSASLKDLSRKHLALDEVIPFKTLFPPKVKKEQRRFDVVPFEAAVPYACQDVLAGWRLHQWFINKLDRSHFIYQLEHDCIKPLAKMELLGVRLNQPQIAEATREAERLMAEQLALIEQAAGRPVVLSKPRDVGALLYQELKLPVLKTSEKTGAASTDAATLRSLQGKHPVVDAILAYREAEKIKAGFLDPLPTFVQKDGCIHTQYNQYGAVSGRLSSKEPNLQQVPKERGKSSDALRAAVRSSILPPPGFVGFLDIDYSQIEYRLFASLSGDPGLMAAFFNDIDVHVQTAAVMLKKAVEDVDKNDRQRGKSLNFMAIYGGSKFKLAEMLGCSVEEAEKLLGDYWKNLPKAQRYVESIKSRARGVGYTETFFGRRRAVPGINSGDRKERSSAEREAVNTAVQGTAADLIKMAIVRSDKVLEARGFKSRLVLTVHDELVVAHHQDDDLDAVANAMQWAMEISMPGWCDMVSEPGYGSDWNSIEDFKYENRRKGGTSAPATIELTDSSPGLTPSIMTESPPISDAVALTLHLPATLERDRVKHISEALRRRPGPVVLFLQVGPERFRAQQGVSIDRSLLLQFRQEGLQYGLSAGLEAALTKMG
jgi:DNA polymerase I